jgi:hypothetical protein
LAYRNEEYYLKGACSENGGFEFMLEISNFNRKKGDYYHFADLIKIEHEVSIGFSTVKNETDGVGKK